MVTAMVIRAQAQNKINFLVMNEATIEGKKFAIALEKSGMKQIGLATQLQVKPQRIVHWKKRGVAASHAALVAEILGVKAADISNLAIEPEHDKNVVAEREQTYAHEREKLFASLSQRHAVELIVEFIPILPKYLRVKIAQAALIDLPEE